MTKCCAHSKQSSPGLMNYEPRNLKCRPTSLEDAGRHRSIPAPCRSPRRRARERQRVVAIMPRKLREATGKLWPSANKAMASGGLTRRRVPSNNWDHFISGGCETSSPPAEVIETSGCVQERSAPRCQKSRVLPVAIECFVFCDVRDERHERQAWWSLHGRRPKKILGENRTFFFFF